MRVTTSSELDTLREKYFASWKGSLTSKRGKKKYEKARRDYYDLYRELRSSVQRALSAKRAKRRAKLQALKAAKRAKALEKDRTRRKLINEEKLKTRDERRKIWAHLDYKRGARLLTDSYVTNLFRVSVKEVSSDELEAYRMIIKCRRALKGYDNENRS